MAVDAPPAPAFPTPDEALSFTHIPGVTPEFLQHFDVRWAHGDLPFTASAKAELGGWMRMTSPSKPFGYADLFLLADVWPPAVLPMVRGVAPGSSLSWTLEPIQLPAGKTSGNWWQYGATTDYFHDGYGHCAAKIWDDEGRLVALSRQTVVVFA